MLIFHSFTETFSESFFMRKRNIKQLRNVNVNDDLLPLIVKNAAELEKLGIFPEKRLDSISLAQLRHLTRLEIDCQGSDQRSLTALIKELRINNQLEVLGISKFNSPKNFVMHLRS